MGELEARPIPGTEQTLDSRCFHPMANRSPFLAVDGAVKTIAVSGGAAVTICAANRRFWG